MKKLSFSKNLSSRICPKVDSDYPRGTYKNAVYHFHGTMQTIITFSLRPVLKIVISEMNESNYHKYQKCQYVM